MYYTVHAGRAGRHVPPSPKLLIPEPMHIANMKTSHFDWTQYPSPEDAQRAFRLVQQGDPDVIVFHQLPMSEWDLVRKAYETGAEVVLTAYPLSDRNVTVTVSK